MRARRIILKNYFDGKPTLANFELVEESIPETLEDREILLKAIWLSVEPSIRIFGKIMNVGDTIMGSQVAQVIASRHPSFPEGKKVVAYVGWRDITRCNPDKLKGMFRGVFPMPDLQDLPDSYALGVCGLTGLAAYFGMLKICQPKSGETVVISSAAGGTGSVAGQIAKLKGCKVIGFAGSEEKVKWVQEDLKFDFAFNYKEVHLDSILKKYAVEGVNCYFDNVGGDLTFWVLQNTNESGRVALCGAISAYNDDPKTTKVQFDYTSMIYKQIKMEGFLANRWFNEWGPALTELIGWVKDGRVKSRETIVEGFENIPQAFIDMFEGKNVGKMIVAV